MKYKGNKSHPAPYVLAEDTQNVVVWLDFMFFLKTESIISLKFKFSSMKLLNIFHIRLDESNFQLSLKHWQIKSL